MSTRCCCSGITLRASRTRRAPCRSRPPSGRPAGRAPPPSTAAPRPARRAPPGRCRPEPDRPRPAGGSRRPGRRRRRAPRGSGAASSSAATRSLAQMLLLGPVDRGIELDQHVAGPDALSPSRTRIARTTPTSNGCTTLLRPVGTILPCAVAMMSTWPNQAQASATQKRGDDDVADRAADRRGRRLDDLQRRRQERRARGCAAAGRRRKRHDAGGGLHRGSAALATPDMSACRRCSAA